MDNIHKFLQRLTKKERLVLLKIISDIRLLEITHYDVKSLQGHQNLFRLRKGKFRIVFAKVDKKGILLNISYRKDAYRSL